MKRALSILAICALLLVGLSTFALADGGAASLAITAKKVGEQVVATVKLNDYTAGELSAMTVDVNYNSDALTYKSVEGKIPEVEVQVKDNGAGKLLLCWVASELPATDDGIIAILTFDVKEVAVEESIGLSAGFVADGMVEKGETEAIPEEDQEKIFNSAPAELPEKDDIVIYPEGQEPGEEPDEPVVPTPSNQTIYSTTEPNNKVYFNIGASYKEGGTVPVYKVNVTWDNGDIKFTAEGKEWAPSEHDWAPIGTPETAAKWEGTGSIKMENHSCEDVNVTFKYTPNGNDTVMEFKKDDVLVPETGISIEASAETQEGQEVTPPGKAEVEVAIVSGTITDGENIGKIVVKIA